MEPHDFIAREVESLARGEPGEVRRKVEAVSVLLLDQRRPSLRSVARDHGVARSTLCRLRDQVRRRGMASFRRG